MKVRGYARKHHGKHSGGVGKTLGTNSREQWQRGRALLGTGGEESNGKGGRILVDFGRIIDQDILNQIVYRLQILVREWT